MVSSKTWIEHLYVILGILDLAVACLITLGVGFSSTGLMFKLAIFVDIPIAIGLIAYITPRRPLIILMLFGCLATLVYIFRYTYWSIKNGESPLPFHFVWVCLSFVLVGLALAVYKRSSLRLE